MIRPTLLLLTGTFIACADNSGGSCIATVPSTLLHEVRCAPKDGPQGICFSEVGTGF